MGNLAQEREAEWLTDMFMQPQVGPYPCAANTKYYANLIYTLDPVTARPKNPGDPDEIVAGALGLSVDNSTGAANAKRIAFFTGILALELDATNPPTAADYFKPAYATSNHEISRKRGTGSLAGIIIQVTGTKVYTWVGPVAVQSALAISLREAVRIGTVTPVVVSLDDQFVGTNLAVAGAVAVTGPTGANVGHEYVVHDVKGDGAANNITITPAAGETINGAATLVINANRATKRLKKVTATDWAVV